MTTIEDWLNDREPYAHWSNRGVATVALELGVTDRRVVANAIALVETACELSNRYPNVSFDALVDGLLNGLHQDAEPYWWYRRWINRVKLWWTICKDDIYGFVRRVIGRIRG